MTKSEPIFPTPLAVAELRPHSQTIHLHELFAHGFAAKVSANDHIGLACDLEVILHELTHWFDLVGTVWGQGYLRKVYDAYRAVEDSSEGTFWRCIDLFDEDRRILLPRYYHVIEDEDAPHSVDRPWRISMSCGVEFAPDGRQNFDRPILFVIFGDHDTDRRIARQPLTVGSLIETCAVWSELRTVMETLAAADPDQRLVETQLWSRQKTGMLYSPAFSEYVAPAHLLSWKVGTKELFRSFEHASALARICLNLTPEHFQSLKHPDSFDAFEDRRQAFARNCDRGYAFAAIAYQARHYDPNVETETWLSDALQTAGLPDAPTIRRNALKHIEDALTQDAGDAPVDILQRQVFTIGLDNCRRTGAGEVGGYTLDTVVELGLHTPAMFAADLKYLTLPTALPLTDFDPEFMLNLEYGLDDVTRNILVGCRGFPDS